MLFSVLLTVSKHEITKTNNVLVGLSVLSDLSNLSVP